MKNYFSSFIEIIRYNFVWCSSFWSIEFFSVKQKNLLGRLYVVYGVEVSKEHRKTTPEGNPTIFNL